MDRPCPGRIWGRGGKLLEFLSSFGVVVGDELLFDDDNSLLDTAAGYIDGMLLTFFEITKYQ